MNIELQNLNKKINKRLTVFPSEFKSIFYIVNIDNILIKTYFFKLDTKSDNQWTARCTETYLFFCIFVCNDNKNNHFDKIK